MSYVAPAGTYMGLADVVGGYSIGLARADGDVALGEEIARASGAAQAWPIASGRAAMTFLLRAMALARGDATRNEVLIPAYTCYSVPASIERAGLVPRVCDVDPASYGLDITQLERCDFRRVLAIVSANLYGIPNDLTAIERIARENRVYLIDDAAQALGARIDGRAVGTFGDTGLYSFDKGKVICTIQGGVIVTRETRGALADALRAAANALPAPTLAESLMNGIKLPIYVLGLRPFLYGLIRRLPFLGLGRTEYETRFPIARLGRLQTGVARRLLPRVGALNSARRANAEKLGDALAGLPGIELPAITARAEPIFTRFPLRVVDATARARLVEELDRAGIGATMSYPRALVDVPEVADRLGSPVATPGARTVASQIVTLPTHGYCPADLGDRVRRIASRVLR
jgi:dTDP-4-amino-4,6-dideoxygalactose transaminase